VSKIDTPIGLVDRPPVLRDQAIGRALYVRFGRMESTRKGSDRVDLYDLLGVRYEGREVFIRYAGYRVDAVTTGLPLAGGGANPIAFWTKRRPENLVVLFPAVA
jgi:hypothetical protein